MLKNGSFWLIYCILIGEGTPSPRIAKEKSLKDDSYVLFFKMFSLAFVWIWISHSSKWKTNGPASWVGISSLGSLPLKYFCIKIWFWEFQKPLRGFVDNNNSRTSQHIVDRYQVLVFMTESSTSQLLDKLEKSNVYYFSYSQAVTHPSTNETRCCLTAVIGRELVLSTWYGRRQIQGDYSYIWSQFLS